MAREEPANPMMWMLVQIAEFIAVTGVLPRLLPDDCPGWLAAIGGAACYRSAGSRGSWALSKRPGRVDARAFAAVLARG